MRESVLVPLLLLGVAMDAEGKTARLDGRTMTVEVDTQTGQWSLLDKRSGVRWPSEGTAAAGVSKGLQGGFAEVDLSGPNRVRLLKKNGAAVVFELADQGRALELRYEGKAVGDVSSLADALAITDVEGGYVIVPCREGLLVPADSGKSFRRTFGTSDYEGCHMNVLGLVKADSGLLVTWDDAYVFPELQSTRPRGGKVRQRLTAAFRLRRSARSLRLRPLGKGDWNTLAAGYRRIAERKKLAVTLREKTRRDAHAERMIGAANVKLWTCLARRMNEQSTKEESVKVRWTFDEAARIAEHLRGDLGIERCLFMMGGWTDGGYDCRHPDNLPANPECGGNAALADAIKRIQKLGYVACLHDNVQDMYRDAKSFDPDFIEKRPDGSLITGGRWLGGRAYMVCAPKQLELAQRPQNLPAIRKLFAPWSYFIDTTYAVGPRECHDPNHPIGRNDDIAWKVRLSDYARQMFGLFGSECGREWALGHSDFFEGLVGVAGRHFHNLKPDDLGAVVVPFWEMVYHDCQICWGKYGYAADSAAEYVAHHVLCARPLHYHSVGDHLYWKAARADKGKRPASGAAAARSCYLRCEGGWAEGLHPMDVFLKNTQEVLGPLHAATAHTRLTRLELLTPDRSLRRATYGSGRDATTVVVNFAPKVAEVTLRRGGRVVLPAWGFVVRGPRFAAFHARRWGGLDYADGALFTLRALDEQPLDQSRRVRIFHGFGAPAIRWKGRAYDVRREQTVESK